MYTCVCVSITKEGIEETARAETLDQNFRYTGRSHACLVFSQYMRLSFRLYYVHTICIYIIYTRESGSSFSAAARWWHVKIGLSNSQN